VVTVLKQAFANHYSCLAESNSLLKVVLLRQFIFKLSSLNEVIRVCSLTQAQCLNQSSLNRIV